MRKLTGAAFVSLDGVMQAPGGPTEDPTGGTPPGGLRLLDHQVGAKGVIVTRWAAAGPVPTAGHPAPSTSDAEADRQRRIKEGTW